MGLPAKKIENVQSFMRLEKNGFDYICK